LLFLTFLFARSRWEMESYLRNDCPDLDDIQRTYMDATRSHFWVAVLQESSSRTGTSKRGGASSPHGSGAEKTGKVVGCIGVVPSKDDADNVCHTAILQRLVVSIESRRMRIGSRLLAQFENYVTAAGYKEVRLYTNDLNVSPLKFVRQHGYSVVQIIRRGLMRGSLIIWRKTIVPPKEDAKADRVDYSRLTSRYTAVLD